MRPKGASYSADSCLILRYVVDAERDLTLPVAVVLSNQEHGRIWFRLPQADELIDGVPVTTARPYLEMARAQIETWLQDGALPYAKEPLTPLSPAWWEGVRRLMPWRVRVGPTRIIDCSRAEEEIEHLYAFWVRPSSPNEEQMSRDGMPSEGGLADDQAETPAAVSTGAPS